MRLSLVRHVWLLLSTLLLGGLGRPGTAWAQNPPTASVGVRLFNPANQHYYQAIWVPDMLLWSEARETAARQTYLGVAGHLATVTSEEEYQFLITHMNVHELWIGGYRDHNAADYKTTGQGWRWITGEPWQFVRWGPNRNTQPESTNEVLSFWTGAHTFGDHPAANKLYGYIVEFDTPHADPALPPMPVPQQIERLLGKAVQGYKGLKSYSATVEFTLKMHIETLQTVKADFTFVPPNRFRLEGRGENGKIVAVSDGTNLILATTAAGENTRYLSKPLPEITMALKEAFSLLTSAPKPPSLSALIAGQVDSKLWSSTGVLGWSSEAVPIEQEFCADVRVKFAGENPVQGFATMTLWLDGMRAHTSQVEYRFKALPYTARETHANIKVNAPVSPTLFTFTPPPGAKLINDLGEGEEAGIEYSTPPPARRP